MGNSMARLRSAGQQAKQRRLPAAPTPQQLSDLNRIAAQEQARMQQLPDLEQLNTKDEPLDKLLSRISGAIQPHVIDISHGQGSQKGKRQSAAPTPPQDTAIHMSARDRRTPLPEYIPSSKSSSQSSQDSSSVSAASGRGAMAGRGQQQSRQGQGSRGKAHDDEPGRVQAYVLREVLEAKNAAEAQGSALDLTRFTAEHGIQASEIELLFKYCAVPKVGKFKTFGHEYAFARPPAWWMKGKEQAMFLSEAAVLEASKPPSNPDTSSQQPRQEEKLKNGP